VSCFEGVTVCVLRGAESTVIEVRADVWLTRCAELARILGFGARLYAYPWASYGEDRYRVDPALRDVRWEATT